MYKTSGTGLKYLFDFSSRNLLHTSIVRLLETNLTEKCLPTKENPIKIDENLPEKDSLLSSYERKIIKIKKEDNLLSKMVLRVKSKKTRMKSGLIMLEGKRLLQDAVSAGVKPHTVFFSRKKDLEEINLPSENIKLYHTPYKDLQLWSDLTTSQGIIAFCDIPPSIPETEESFPITVICDQIREPGNLGAIIRNAAGAGVNKIILTPGCTDLWDSKVLRAASGAHFRIPIIIDETWSVLQNVKGNTKICLADNNFGKRFESGSSVEYNLPCVPYYDINYCDYSHTILIIGGETEGLSNNALQLAAGLNGMRINIPLSNELESLNSAAAITVILFEIKRQIICAEK